MMVVSTVYKHKTRGTTMVLPSFRPPKEKPYVMLVAFIHDEIAKSPGLVGISCGLARLGFMLHNVVFWDYLARSEAPS
jgi:hypothetical protein